MQLNDRYAARLAAGLTAVALAMGAAACGSDDDEPASPKGSADGNARQVSESPDPKPEPAGDEATIRQIYDELVDAFYAGDGERACALLTKEAQKGLSGTVPCEKYIKSKAKELSPERPFIASLRVQGDRAEARAGTKKTAKYPVLFKKIDGEWKIYGGY